MTQPGYPTLTSIGSNNFVATQVSVGTSATQLVPSRFNRFGLVLTNTGTTPVCVGGAAVTAQTGALLAGISGTAKAIPFTGALYGIVGAGTQTVTVEEYF